MEGQGEGEQPAFGSALGTDWFNRFSHFDGQHSEISNTYFNSNSVFCVFWRVVWKRVLFVSLFKLQNFPFLACFFFYYFIQRLGFLYAASG